nr:MAG TPA: hypothetical protein [Caudoviricetes sp.]
MSTFKFNQGTMSNEELDKLTKFWAKKRFRTWSKKEIERDSNNRQALLAALKETTVSELASILKMNSDRVIRYHVKSKEFIIWKADEKDLDYAISIAPKTFKVKQG